MQTCRNYFCPEGVCLSPEAIFFPSIRQSAFQKGKIKVFHDLNHSNWKNQFLKRLGEKGLVSYSCLGISSGFRPQISEKL